MECNKEAAIQARELAESKLLLKDYKAAQKFCVKAQSLFPNLENLTQLLTVCSVHCSAEDKINNETDWYGVLQVGTTADELAIKKQYRKLALLLHPDKNKFPGAESAFKLIGEANTILTDRGKRSLHDLKRSGRNNNNAQIRRPSQAARQTGQTSQASQQTFWTICTTCGMRYQHFRNVYRRALRCQNCMQTFVAYDINEQPVQTQNPNNRNPNRNPNPSPMYSFNRPNGSATAGNSNPFQRPSPIFTQFQPGAGTSTGTAESMKFEKVNLERGANAKPSPAGASFANKPPVNPPKSNPPKRTQPQKKKRKRVVEEDEEEEESEADSSESEEEIVLEKEVKMNGTNDPPRRSSRRKNDVKYNEKDNIDEDLEDVLEDDDVSDDDDDVDDAEVDVVDDDVTVTYARKRLRKESDKEKDKRSVPNEKEKDIKMNDKEQEKEKETEMKTKEKEKGKAKQTEESESESESEPKEFVYSEPEFFNFDGLRARTRFAADQVWAAYDSLDGMPRFYALIKTVRHAPAFHLKFTWLESDPSSRSAAAWTRVDLPVACGSFVTGSVETTDELLMFSHMVDYSKGGRGKRGFEIYPKKGEIWAVFKDWDENWSADPEAHGHESFEYEIVEVLSDLGESTGFVVTRLVRLSGFVSVFVRESEKAPFVVPATEILRFSHRVPAYRMSGEEREKVPVGAFELDQASLPCDLDRAFGSVELDLKGKGKEKVSDGEKREKLNGSFSNGKSKEKVDENLDGNLEKKMNETLDGKSNGNSKEKLNGSLNNGKSKEKLGEKLDRKTKAKPSENSDKKSRDKPNEKTDENSISDSVRANENSNTESPEYTYSEAEFYNFAMDRAIHKFQAGQVWALYSDVDQFPKFYGWVKRVDPLHEKIHIRWLEPIADGLTGEAKRWVDQELPIGCGSFEITGSTVSFYNSAFSHLVNVRNCTAGGKRRYEILPRKDEIWAIYRNWTVGWKLEDIKDSCQYEVVQVAEVNEKGIKVEILKKVDGHSAVFARDRARKGMLVPKGEYVRFSHRIPSYRLGEEENGKLRGCFELDSASVPEDLL